MSKRERLFVSLGPLTTIALVTWFIGYTLNWPSFNEIATNVIIVIVVTLIMLTLFILSVYAWTLLNSWQSSRHQRRMGEPVVLVHRKILESTLLTALALLLTFIAGGYTIWAIQTIICINVSACTMYPTWQRDAFLMTVALWAIAVWPIWQRITFDEDSTLRPLA